jgi:hypothetical protein
LSPAGLRLFQAGRRQVFSGRIGCANLIISGKRFIFLGYIRRPTAAAKGSCKIGADWRDPDGFTMGKNDNNIAY